MLVEVNGLGLIAIQANLETQVQALNTQIQQGFENIKDELNKAIEKAEGEYKKKLEEHKKEIARIDKEYDDAMATYKEQLAAYQSALAAYNTAMAAWSAADPATRGSAPTLSVEEPVEPVKEEYPPTPVKEDGSCPTELKRLEDLQRTNMQTMAEITTMTSGIGEILIKLSKSSDGAYYKLQSYTFQNMLSGCSTKLIDMFADAIATTKINAINNENGKHMQYRDHNGYMHDIRIDVRIHNAAEKIVGSDGAEVYLESLLPPNYGEKWFTQAYATDGNKDSMYKHALSVAKGTTAYDTWVALAKESEASQTFVALAMGLGLDAETVGAMLQDAGKPTGMIQYIKSQVTSMQDNADRRKAMCNGLNIEDSILNRLRVRDYISNGIWQKTEGEAYSRQCFTFCLLNCLGEAADEKYTITGREGWGSWTQTITTEDGTYSTSISDIVTRDVQEGKGVGVDDISAEINVGITKAITEGKNVAIQIGYLKGGGSPHWVLISDWTGSLETSTFFDPYGRNTGVGALSTLAELQHDYNVGNGCFDALKIGTVRIMNVEKTA